MSSNPDASYGRLISLLSFIVFNLYYILVSINPKGIFSNSAYHTKMFEYLFYLVLGGYSLTTGKDILLGIWPFNKFLGGGKPSAETPTQNQNEEPDPKP